MQTKQLQDKIDQPEQWLKDNHPEHLAVPDIQNDLRNAYSELVCLETGRTYERDTFDIREHDFNAVSHERQ